jgi:hypothetical protein
MAGLRSAVRMTEPSCPRESHLRLLLVRAKQDQSADRAVPIPLAEMKRVKARPPLRAKLPVTLEPTLRSQALARFVIAARRELLQANLLLRTSPLLALPENRLPKAMLLSRTMARPALALQEMRRQLEQDSAVLRARARRC